MGIPLRYAHNVSSTTYHAGCQYLALVDFLFFLPGCTFFQSNLSSSGFLRNKQTKHTFLLKL